ncbi:hypothetical protein H101_08163 [Trichophyton interdigitale H6]|nr:hypothetical protein H101_08163 [Trichophyton interdigitale H6]
MSMSPAVDPCRCVYVRIRLLNTRLILQVLPIPQRKDAWNGIDVAVSVTNCRFMPFLPCLLSTLYAIKPATSHHVAAGSSPPPPLFFASFLVIDTLNDVLPSTL